MNLSLMAKELESDEGVRLYPYTHTKGYLAIGINRNLDNCPLTTEERKRVGHDGRTQAITHEEAIYLLTNDIKRIAFELNRRIEWWKDLDEVRRRVLLNMAFNLGTTRLLNFTEMLRWTKQGHYRAAAMCLLASIWANQVGERAERLAKMLALGEVYS